MKRKIFIKPSGLAFLIGISLMSSGQQLNTFIGGIDANGYTITLSHTKDVNYNIELLPGINFTGSWFYSISNSAATANLSENPPVDWLEISPSQFTDYPDGIATKVDFIFTVPDQSGVYVTTVTDLEGNWSNMYITLNVTENPPPTVLWDLSVPTMEYYKTPRTYLAPEYFYWEDVNQYYYFEDCVLFETFEQENIPWFTVDPEVICLDAGDSTLVNFTAYFTSPIIDSILAIKKVRYYAYPVYYKFFYDAQILSVSRPVDLFAGWNLIGYSLSSPALPAEAFAPLMDTGVLDMVTGYMQGGLYYDPNGPPYLNTLTEIKTGYGYWVNVNADYQDFSFPVPVSK